MVCHQQLTIFANHDDPVEAYKSLCIRRVWLCIRVTGEAYRNLGSEFTSLQCEQVVAKGYWLRGLVLALFDGKC